MPTLILDTTLVVSTSSYADNKKFHNIRPCSTGWNCYVIHGLGLSTNMVWSVHGIVQLHGTSLHVSSYIAVNKYIWYGIRI